MSAIWEGVQFKPQAIAKDPHENIKAFRLDPEIELQPTLNYPPSMDPREGGSGNIPPARRQVSKAGIDDRTHYKSRLLSRAAANVSRFL